MTEALLLSRRELIAALVLGRPAMASMSRQAVAPDDLTALTIADAMARMARRDFTSVDLVDAYLSRVDRLNPDLHAYVSITRARARADATRAAMTSSSARPLRGIPIAHKDLFDTAGIRTAAGSRLFDRRVPARDADVAAALARAGTVLLGKTNTNELGGGVTTINTLFGTTRNPADRTRISGGSSGGSAAAVRAHLAAVATGSDTGGSVRIPAALCGCVGFKPTFGRLSTAGLLGACPTFDHAGLLTRTVTDAALVFRAIAGVERRPMPAHVPLRVGVARAFFFDGLQPDVDAAMTRAIERIRSLGAIVSDIDLAIDATTASRVFDPIVASEIWARYGSAWRARPTDFAADMTAFFQAPPPPPADVAAARRARAAFQATLDRVFDEVDVVVTPTVPVTAPAIAGPIDAALILRNTWVWNAARTPTISIPCGTDSAGLPIGLQLAGRVGRDDLVLDAAARFTSAG